MRSLGQAYEALAVDWLRTQGLRVIARNFSARTGEIDIVARDGDCLVFVEVRARSHPRFGGAAASVDRRKQRRLTRTASSFLQLHPHWARLPCRFDVIAFEPRQSAGAPEPRWIKGAFSA